MRSIFFIKSNKSNTYLVNIQKKTILLVHPLIPTIYYGYIASSSSLEYEYYNKKLAYYKKHNLISETLDLHINPLEISPEKVEESIANTNQIVFETTERCNLKCKYCFYEEIYETRERKAPSNLSFKKTSKIIDHVVNKLNNYNNSTKHTIYISFYGGEPLLNTVLISDTIDYCRKLPSTNRVPKYTITTNGTLLNKHIDLLVKNNFRITVTLDGNKANNSYRVFHDDENSFDAIMSNLESVKKKFPDYFKTNVVFNTVLHNKNSMEEVYSFFKVHFDTQPALLEINNSGIKEGQLDEFEKMYQSKNKSIDKAKESSDFISNMSMDNPTYHSAAIFLHQYMWFVYKTYRHQLLGDKIEYQLSTGTCLPFSKKIFVTADGKILPCEKISHEHVLGYVTDEEVNIDTQAIANKYNKTISVVNNQCKSCYKLFACEQCIFFLDSKKPICYAYMNEVRFSAYLQSNISFIEEHPNDYQVIMKEILFS